jgi:hypothetical protein
LANSWKTTQNEDSERCRPVKVKEIEISYCMELSSEHTIRASARHGWIWWSSHGFVLAKEVLENNDER